MIAPSRVLLLIVAVLGVPLCTLAVWWSALLNLWIIVFVAFALAAVSDAYLGSGRLRSVGVISPEIVKLARRRPGVLPLKIRNEGSVRISALRIAPVCPEPLHLTEPFASIAELPPRSGAPCNIEVTATERGNWPVTQCFLEVASPLRLWLVRSQRSLPLTVQAYPNLAENAVAATLLRRSQHGLKAYRQVGQGREFEKLREYLPGDTFDQIHWKATARRAHPVTKVFQVEQSQQCYVLIDCSRQTAAHHALDYFVEAALVLGLAAQQAGDAFGVLTFSDRVHAFHRARPGKAQFARCRRAIYALQPQPVSADFTELATFTQERLRKRALLFLLTGLADPYAAESLTGQIRLLTRRHVVVVGALRQPEVNRIFDGPRPETIHDLYTALAGHFSWAKLRELGRDLETHGAELALCSPDTIYADLSNCYRQIRQRQLV